MAAGVPRDRAPVLARRAHQRYIDSAAGWKLFPDADYALGPGWLLRPSPRY